jgi:hypothetical protein
MGHIWHSACKVLNGLDRTENSLGLMIEIGPKFSLFFFEKKDVYIRHLQFLYLPVNIDASFMIDKEVPKTRSHSIGSSHAGHAQCSGRSLICILEVCWDVGHSRLKCGMAWCAAPVG